MTLLSRKRLLGVSLIALAALASCTDEVDGGRDAEPGGSRLYFTVGMEGEGTQTRADGSGAATATRYLDPVEMQGKLDGKPVYLQAEETDGFPGDGQPLTRGTQITTATHMGAFAVSAYTDPTGTPDQMYNMKVKDVSSAWSPEEDYFWPKGEILNFYAWYPYADAVNGLSVTDENTAGAPTLTYSIPQKVEDQQDVMTAVKLNQPQVVGGVQLQFKHALSAVKFVTGDALSQCTLNRIKLKGVKYKGTFQLGATGWTLENDTTSYTFNLGVDMDGTPDVAITAGDQTLLLMPQAFEDENAELEVSMTVPSVGDCVFSAKLKDIFKNGWKVGKTYTCRISDNLSGDLGVEVTFFKNANGTDGNPYTAHNISANGDPFTIDVTYSANHHITAITARLAYEMTVDGVTTYEAFQEDLDLTGKTTADFTSLCMNNTGTPGKAKASATPFVVQVKVASYTKVTLPADPNDPDTPQKYYPGKDNNTWFTIWRGTMYPPNYIDATYKVIVSREDAGNVYGARYPGVPIETAVKLQSTYYEVDENHPTYGKGKWSLPKPLESYTVESIHKADVICDMLDNQLPPGGNSLYGRKMNTNLYAWTANIHYNTNKYGVVTTVSWAWQIKGRAGVGGGYYKNYNPDWYRQCAQRGPVNEVRNEQISIVSPGFGVFARNTAARMTIQY